MPWINGLDLGCAQDYTALACLEQQRVCDPITKEPGRKWTYQVRHLERYDLGQSYPTMIELAKKTLEKPPLTGSRLAIDFTGVGRPVLDIINLIGLPVKRVPILITGGHAITRDADTGAYHVPKKELVSTLQILMQSGRLKIAKSMPLADKLSTELSNFRVKITASANESFGAWRDGQHDDLVLAVALACWLGENVGGGDVKGISLPPQGGRNVIESAPPGVFAS
jgi:hypothetical protein